MKTTEIVSRNLPEGSFVKRLLWKFGHSILTEKQCLVTAVQLPVIMIYKIYRERILCTGIVRLLQSPKSIDVLTICDNADT